MLDRLTDLVLCHDGKKGELYRGRKSCDDAFELEQPELGEFYKDGRGLTYTGYANANE